MYFDVNNLGEKFLFLKYIVKFYCVDDKCNKVRFFYFELKLYLEIKLVG